MFILLAVLLAPVEKPAQFEIRIESRTPYSLVLNGQQIKANHVYKTEPLSEPCCIEVELKYVSGDRLVTETIFIDLHPGYKVITTIELKCRPTLAWC